ncbi:hypothetical protein [Streptomyces sp. VRA16 Mangrove soil]|uniref:hypothetical protein n=1 Tax=Streptomyces sp. VRA16 Mangrove soil TaxID=2817434 RepID=UPI001A9E8F9C|nr:hypothetical protein [Streptomyces sp. VRA16 Mangrove soil]MBO1335819.1 hypothetical protein [Streptomyces sp. VRA16 Mangrove soil]
MANGTAFAAYAGASSLAGLRALPTDEIVTKINAPDAPSEGTDPTNPITSTQDAATAGAYHGRDLYHLFGGLPRRHRKAVDRPRPGGRRDLLLVRREPRGDRRPQQPRPPACPPTGVPGHCLPGPPCARNGRS